MRFLAWSTLLAFLWYTATVHAQYYPITGVQTGRGQSGSRPARRDILDMQNDPATFALYLQALIRMQNTNENDQLSWLQVAGIHGRPWIDWNNVGNTPGAPAWGYCTHTSILFLTWHRPYLVLLEQVLAGHVQAIANTYPPANAAQYQAAANNFRIPYWDWATNPNMPDIVNQPTVQINTPTGPRSVDNPLYTYKFKTLNLRWFPTTQDYPTSTYRQTIRGNVAQSNAYLRSEDLRSKTWTSVVKSRDFNTFATSATEGTSIENVHNIVHGDVGLNGGHMGSLQYSAFDPIFWLHHANIDRLFAMWQAINPNLYLQPMNEPQGTYTIRANNLDTSTTPLGPFTSNTAGQFYTSDSARSLSPFGYTYPEIQDWNQTPDQLRQNCTGQLNRLYNPSGTLRKRDTALSQIRTWSAGISVSKFDVPSRFIVRVFLGTPPTNPMAWFTSNECLGSLFVQQPPNLSGYHGPNPKILVHDEVDLDGGLRDKGYDGQNAKAVANYLKEGLQWRVQSYDGTVIPNEKLPTLKVVVQEEMVTPAKSITELPMYGKKILHPEVTKGRVAAYIGTAAG